MGRGQCYSSSLAILLEKPVRKYLSFFYTTAYLGLHLQVYLDYIKSCFNLYGENPYLSQLLGKANPEVTLHEQ